MGMRRGCMGVWSLAALSGLFAIACGSSSSDGGASPAMLGCSQDTQCLGGQHCDSATHECVAGVGTGGAGGASGAGGQGGNASAGAPLNADDEQAGTACSTVPQAGCPAEHTCNIVDGSGNRGCFSAGSLGLGAICSQVNDCAAGLTCSYRVCEPYCAQSSDCSRTKYTACLAHRDASGNAIPGYSTCSPQCNPADPTNGAGRPDFDGCPSGQTCDLTGNASDPSGATSCFLAGGVGEGGTCQKISDCAPGLTCLNDQSGNASCAPRCLKGISSCNCQSFAEPEYVGTSNGLVELGYCG